MDNGHMHGKSGAIEITTCWGNWTRVGCSWDSHAEHSHRDNRENLPHTLLCLRFKSTAMVR